MKAICKNTVPVRRVIKDGNVPLPKNWKNFLALVENKVNLIEFVSKNLTVAEMSEAVIGGGFSDERGSFFFNEETDTMMIWNF